MKGRFAKILGSLALAWLGGTAVAGEPLPTGLPVTTASAPAQPAPKSPAPPLIQPAPAIPSLGPTTHHAPSHHGPSAPCTNCGSAPVAHHEPERCMTPPMIGDLFFGGLAGIAAPFVPGDPVVFLPEPGGFSRYTRISENGFVLPTDRVFVNYNYLNGVLGSDVNAFMVGVEKTFLDGIASVQLNLPIYASTISSTQSILGGTGTDGEFGNISVWLKALLYNDNDLAVSAGLGFNTPTGNDVRLIDGAGTVLARVYNETMLVNPFVGALWTPSDDFFIQGFTQLDIDTWGNTVQGLDGSTSKIRSSLLWYTGIGAGYVLFNDASSTISSVVPMAELHYTTNLGGSSGHTSTAGHQIVSRTVGINTLNLVAGVNTGIGNNAMLTVGGGVPIIGSDNRQYNWQVLAQLNILFGGPR